MNALRTNIAKLSDVMLIEAIRLIEETELTQETRIVRAEMFAELETRHPEVEEYMSDWADSMWQEHATYSEALFAALESATDPRYYCAHTRKEITGTHCPDCNRLDCVVTARELADIWA